MKTRVPRGRTAAGVKGPRKNVEDTFKRPQKGIASTILLIPANKRAGKKRQLENSGKIEMLGTDYLEISLQDTGSRTEGQGIKGRV